MDNYHMLTLEQACSIPLTQLVELYNDAIYTVRHYEHKIIELMEENEAVWTAYEEVSDQLYG